MVASQQTKSRLSDAFDPDEYRMSLGEHLEELRMRLMLGLGVFFLVAIVCLAFGEHVTRFFLRPLEVAQIRTHQSQQIYYTEAAESFTVMIKASLIVATAVSSPWLLYQLWQFVAAGLYPKERKYVTKYLPLSITLLIVGMVFLYLFVLPLMLEFFLTFGMGDPMHTGNTVDAHAATQPAFVVPRYDGDPPKPLEGQMWIDGSQHRLKFVSEGALCVIPYGNAGSAMPLITLATYIDMVINLLLSFGLAFQMPLVVLALVRIGIVDVPALKKMRRIVYFSMSIVSAFIVPDVVTGMIALMVPLILLFEMGLWLARDKPADPQAN
jgi:sec-independent protein translocase protein TatC